MREILFRGKRVDNGEWVEGFYVREWDTTYQKEYHNIFTGINNFNDQMGRDGYQKWEVNPETVGQYTGLKDKNGKRIFEGDILQNRYTCAVKYGDFNCSCCDGVYGWYFDGGDIRGYDLYEVIGNIHDNPELIGGQQ